MDWHEGKREGRGRLAVGPRSKPRPAGQLSFVACHGFGYWVSLDTNARVVIYSHNDGQHGCDLSKEGKILVILMPLPVS